MLDIALSLDSVTVRRHNSLAINQVSFTAGSGELIALLGQSGAGKTTLLRAIAGLQRIQVGKIFCDGDDISLLPTYRRPVAMVMNRPTLFGHLTVSENIALAADPHGVPVHEQIDVAQTALGISHLGHQYPDELSTGQQQKVALARAFVHRPRILLFDEPLAHVDTYASAQLKAELVALHRRMNCVTLYVTHDVSEAFSVADRILYLAHGRVIQDDFPQEVHDCPATLDIARHLGASVFLSARARINVDRFGNPTASFELFNQHVHIAGTPELTAQAHKNTEIIVVGYPDSIEATPVSHTAQALGVAGDIGQIISLVYLGTHYQVQIETESGTIGTMCTPDAPLSSLTPGDAVRIRMRPDRMWALPQIPHHPYAQHV